MSPEILTNMLWKLLYANLNWVLFIGHYMTDYLKNVYAREQIICETVFAIDLG